MYIESYCVKRTAEIQPFLRAIVTDECKIGTIEVSLTDMLTRSKHYMEITLDEAIVLCDALEKYLG